MEKVYKSPMIKFEKLSTSESIAATCWGNHGTNTVMYYNTEGAGYVSFTVAGAGECQLNEVTDITIVQCFNCTVSETELYNQLIKAGGANGNPWNGTNFSPTPPTDWS